MRIFGKDIARSLRRLRAAGVTLLAPPSSGRWITIFDQFSGAWQTDTALDQATVLRFAAVYRSIAVIAGDIAKLPLRLIGHADGVWSEYMDPHPLRVVLRRPNAFQTRLEFVMYWLCSLLITGNTYALKRRDKRGVVVAMTVIDPNSVTPLVAPDGAVFYRLGGVEFLHGLGDVSEVTIPASEIIHDKYICLNHPLIGCAPLQVAGAAASAGYKIVSYNASFFANQARPSGVIEAPEEITAEQATEIKTAWNSFTETNSGKVAVLENGLKYAPLAMNSTDAQMLETLKWNTEDIARAFGLPGWLIGAGTEPTAANAELRMRGYYSQCLQVRMEAIELLLDEGLGLLDKADIGIEFDTEPLLRMDSKARWDMYKTAIGTAGMTPNEARAREGMRPKPGGDALYLQQQNYSLEALAKRDAKPDPFATAKPPAPPAAAGSDDEPADDGEASEADLAKAISEALRAPGAAA